MILLVCFFLFETKRVEMIYQVFSRSAIVEVYCSVKPGTKDTFGNDC